VNCSDRFIYINFCLYRRDPKGRPYQPPKILPPSFMQRKCTKNVRVPHASSIQNKPIPIIFIIYLITIPTIELSDITRESSNVYGYPSSITRMLCTDGLLLGFQGGLNLYRWWRNDRIHLFFNNFLTIFIVNR
jgi:hypothetical protein